MADSVATFPMKLHPAELNPPTLEEALDADVLLIQIEHTLLMPMPIEKRENLLRQHRAQMEIIHRYLWGQWQREKEARAH